MIGDDAVSVCRVALRVGSIIRNMYIISTRVIIKNINIVEICIGLFDVDVDVVAWERLTMITIVSIVIMSDIRLRGFIGRAAWSSRRLHHLGYS